MAETWYVLSLFGKDQQGIVAEISNALFALNANLCETSMCRLGDYFTILAFISHTGNEDELNQAIANTAGNMNLQFHVDRLAGHTHNHAEPDIVLHFHGNDRTGLIAKVSSALNQANINILDLQSDVAQSSHGQQFFMSIEADASKSSVSLEQLQQTLQRQDINVTVNLIDAFVG